MKEKVTLRPLRPAAKALHSEPSYSKPKEKRQSVACRACRAKRRKCTGAPICQSCVRLKLACDFEPYKDKRRKLALQHVENARQRLEILFELLLTFLNKEEDETILEWRKCLKDTPSLEMMIADLERRKEPGL
ncbi:Zn(II)2Cys6 transcription factor domain-containing protein [Aspergillus vadensis CBS 113365]|uniref:Zn(2)-C6 fungal-type domain-containing protein n=1 Tax=Aspergillus vadensis (strain CBS 113365 / IMI 142717 / IBT 24658) TaxID=1448311 RepID=A0A319B0J6_ASPVC|nr:hypothetical protein BO88DRAFT_408988 [Aspergillus vadensis CBS 113365]PYH63680.1 hypothetical protein BO88DRAFT_408988 [Aspergillus vadensis CBS 113365]